MASVANDPNGRKRILYFNAAGERKTIRLGKVTKQQAAAVKLRIELLVSAKINGTAPDDDTSRWAASIGDDLHAKLAEHGLLAARVKTKPVDLKQFIDGYIANRTDVKSGTAVVYGHTRRCLVEYFGPEKPIDKITPAEADDWRRWLGLAKKAGGQGLAENTVRRRCGIARQFFRDAVRRRLIAESPFAEMRGVVVRANRSRDYFVSRGEAQAVLDACPDAQWQLLFALSRYGGLRCPSEHLALTWGDVDFDRDKITVRSPKTEHHEGKSERIMPLFPELRPFLEAVRDEVLASNFDPKKHRLSEQPVITRYRDRNSNLRTQLRKIIRRAGLKPWPKLFQNLRATRATELADQFPAHVAADWLGHSTTIADKHYRQTTEEHFDRATGKGLLKRAVEAAQKAAQSVAADMGTDLQGPEREMRDSLYVRQIPRRDAAKVGDTGFEPVTSAV